MSKADGIPSRLFPPKNLFAGQTSPTPILDLIEPLPKPADQIVTGKFAFPFLTFAAIAVVNQNYSLLVILLSFLPALLLAVAIHECGHLIFGWCAGLAFRGVEIGPFCLLRIRRKWFLRVRPRIYIGGAHMVLRRIRRIRHQLVTCTLGGPATSYGFAVLAFTVGEICRPSDNYGWTTFLEFSAFLSLIIALFSTFPYRTRLGGNDAYLLRQLLASKADCVHMIAAHAAFFAATVEPIPPPYFERWWKLASLHFEAGYSPFYVGWNAYREAKDPAIAASHLEQLLRSSGRLDVQTRNHLVAEAAFFTAHNRSSVGHCSVWLRRTRHQDWLDPLSRIRLDVALAESRQESAKALGICDSGLALIRANLNGPHSVKIESEWVDWKRQIEAKLTSAECDVLKPC